MIYLTRIEVRYRARNTGSCAVCDERVTIRDQKRGRPIEFRLANATSTKWIPAHSGCLRVADDDPVAVGAPDFASGLLGGLLGTVLGNVLTGSRSSRSSFRDRRGNGVSLRKQPTDTAPTRPALPAPNAPIDAEFEEK